MASTFPIMKIDEMSGSVTTIDVGHGHIHDGEFFSSCAAATSLSSGNVVDVLIYPGATAIPHIIMEFSSPLAGIVSIYKGPTLAGGLSSGAGDLTITVRGVSEDIAVIDNRTSAQLATAIAAGTWTGWTPAVVSTTTVRFTADAVGAQTAANAISFGAVLDAYGTFAITTPGTAGAAEVITLSLFAFGGTDIAFVNNNFLSTNTTDTKLITGTSFATPGTELERFYLGGDKSQAPGSAAGQRVEWISSRSIPMLVRFTSSANSNSFAVNVYTYEESI